MISLIAAHGHDFVIGKDNWMPWDLPRDLQFFKEKTIGKTIVMGRKTFESFKKPLKDRHHIVLTRQEDFSYPGVDVYHDIDALKQARETREDEVLVIAGGEIYKQFLPVADRLYITYIDATFEGDTYVPDYTGLGFIETSKQQGIKDSDNPYDYYFIQYDRDKPTKTLKG